MFNRNHVLHRDSSSGVPELLSGPIDTRRGKSAEGDFSFVRGSPLAGSDDSNRDRIHGSHDSRECEYIPSVFLRFFILASYRILLVFASRKELSNRAPLVRFSCFFKISSRFILPSFRFLFSSCGENLSLNVCKRGLFVKEWHISRSPSNGPA